MRAMKGGLVGLAVAGLVGCGEDDKPTTETAVETAEVTDETAETGEETTPDVTEEAEVVDPNAEGPCDPIDPSHCMYPFPSNLYLTADAARATGFTLDFGNALPKNLDDKPIESAPYKRLDGYGVGTPILTGAFPDIDYTGLATEFDTAPSLAADAPILWFEDTGTTLVRVPYFVDKDVTETDPAKRVLVVRPAAIMKEGTRYVVAFRNVKNTAGATIAPSEAFAAFKAGTASGASATRQAGFDAVFADLTAAGVDKASLQLAWDFTTASCDALHGTMQHMISDAFATTGESGPALVDIEVEVLEHETWALEIRGNIEVPHYMKPTPMYGTSGDVWIFNDGPDGKPVQNGTRKAPFWIRVPKSAIPAEGEAAIPHALVMYGHGQNGEGTQVRSGTFGRIAQDYHYIYFATDMWGMAEEDVSGIIDMLFDLSGFPRMADRLHQGMLNHVLLARSMREHLPALAAITERGIAIDKTRLYYTGISQGGIYGATVVALSPDMQRGHLGVPGNNYGFLLSRSRNFAPFFIGLESGYPERWRQLTVIPTIELLWEQGDPVSYMRHLHDSPFPGQGPNEVLLAPAKGDVQVPVTSNEWVARSNIGIPIMAPYDTDRPAPSGTETATYPRTGSGIVLYNYGNPWPTPSEIVPPTSDAPDPHGSPRGAAHHNRQLAHFLETGEIIDVCSEDGTPGCTPE